MRRIIPGETSFKKTSLTRSKINNFPLNFYVRFFARVSDKRDNSRAIIPLSRRRRDEKSTLRLFIVDRVFGSDGYAGRYDRKRHGRGYADQYYSWAMAEADADVRKARVNQRRMGCILVAPAVLIARSILAAPILAGCRSSHRLGLIMRLI